MIKRALILFSGTKSVSKVLEKYGVECRCVDIDNFFKPITYNVDILTWDYKEDLKDWTPDYIHASPVCKEFSKMKNINRCEGHKRNMELGISLVKKSLEIIDYFKVLNPNLKFTLENPKGLLRKQEIMKKYDRITTSYCQYDFLYRKDTDFWFSGFELKLKDRCKSTKDDKYWCESKKIFKAHKVRLGLSNNKDIGTFTRNHKEQIGDSEYFKSLKSSKHKVIIGSFKKKVDQERGFDYFTKLRKTGNFKGWKDKYFRYQIPEGLIEDIYKSLTCNKNSDNI